MKSEWIDRLRQADKLPAVLTSAKVSRLFNHQIWAATQGRHGERLVIRSRDYECLNLDGIDFSGALIADISFAWSTMRECRFTGASLWNVSFEHCDLDRAVFRDTDFNRVSLAGVDRGTIDFGSADLSLVYWSEEEYDQAMRCPLPKLPILDR